MNRFNDLIISYSPMKRTNILNLIYIIDINMFYYAVYCCNGEGGKWAKNGCMPIWFPVWFICLLHILRLAQCCCTLATNPNEGVLYLVSNSIFFKITSCKCTKWYVFMKCHKIRKKVQMAWYGLTQVYAASIYIYFILYCYIYTHSLKWRTKK